LDIENVLILRIDELAKRQGEINYLLTGNQTCSAGACGILK
jgi:hypothetical protein